MNKIVFVVFGIILLSATVLAYENYYSVVPQNPVLYNYPKAPVVYYPEQQSSPYNAQNNQQGNSNEYYPQANYYNALPSKQNYNTSGQSLYYPSMHYTLSGFIGFNNPALTYYYYYPAQFLSYYSSQTYTVPHNHAPAPVTKGYKFADYFAPSRNEIIVSATEYSFYPRSIEVRRGEKVRILFENDGGQAHTFTVRELGIDTGLVYPGQSKTVEFTVPDRKKLSFISYCRIAGHREQGMAGRIIITD